ncbi:MAG: hypothetical protein KBD19_01280 [Candidatus Moranbacteria bacterium]|nr:hypothetical protein [Candidatus Moranbacteria bacterium]
MSKKIAKKKFQPFVHDNLDIKNELLQLARKARESKSIENDLASVLIYSNIAEYLAEHLLDTLSHLVYKSSYNSFGGILFVESVSRSGKKTLNQTVEELEKFNFPDKDGIVHCFRKIADSRNRIFHNFAKSDINSIKDLLEKDLPVIQEECEEIINKVNTVYAGLQKILGQQENGNESQDEK